MTNPRVTAARQEAWRDNEEAVAGALICFGGMLYEWGLPIDKAIAGLKAAYALEHAKQEKNPCTCRPEDRPLCLAKARCVQVETFNAKTT